MFDWTDDKGEKRETKITWLRAAIVIQKLIDQGRYLENSNSSYSFDIEKPDENEGSSSNASDKKLTVMSQTKTELEVKPISKPHPVRTNFRYSEAYNLYPGDEKTKYRNNVEAIKLLKKIESEKQLATPDELAPLFDTVKVIDLDERKK